MTRAFGKLFFQVPLYSSFLLISSCNILVGENGQTTEASFHPGFSPAPSGPAGPAPTVAISTVVSAATDDSVNQFAGGSLTGVAYSGGKLALGSGGTCNGTTANCAELDASWAPEWASLVSYWKMNNDWTDSLGNNSGSVQGNATFNSSAKVGSYAGSFSGSDSDYVTFGTTNLPTGTNERTVAIWFKMTGTAAQALFNYGGNSAGQRMDIFYDGTTRFGIESVNYQRYFTWTRDTNWHHFVAVFPPGETTTDKWLLYLDGVLQTGIDSGAAQTINTTTSSPMFSRLNAANGYGYNGLLDDAALWSKALSAADVKTIYDRQSIGIGSKYGGSLVSRVLDAGTSKSWTNFSWLPTLPFFKELPDAGMSESSVDYSALVGSDGTTATHDLMSGNVGLWHFDGSIGAIADGASIVDSSGSAAHGSTLDADASNTIQYQDGKVGQSLYFDGSNDWVSTSNISINTAEDFAFSFWIRPESTSNWKTILRLDNNNKALILTNSPTDTNVYWEGTSGGQNFTTTPIYYSQSWYHIVAQRRSGVLEIYVNGIQDARTPPDTRSFTLSGFGYSGFGSEYYKGALDELSFWRRALHANEVKQLYQRGASRLKFQVKSCSSFDCSDNTTWQGPDGTNQTYFSELNNNSLPLAQSGSVLATLPNLLFSSFTSPPSASRYFQYRTIFEADDTDITLGPQLKNVQISTSASQVLPIYTVTGTCSEEGRAVSVTLSDGSTSATGTGTCVSGTFTAYVDVSSLADGTLTVTASQTSSGGVTGSGTGTYTGSNTALPANATALVWTEGTSTTNFTIHASWTKSASSDLQNQKIQFYTGTCSATTGSFINLGSASITSYAFTGLNGNTYSYKLTSVDSSGNSQTSACSTTIAMTTVLTDNSNSTTTPSFYQGSHVGTAWSTNKVALDSSGTPTNNSELDASWTPHYNDSPTAKVVAHWKMDDNWEDSVGSLTGSAQNGATFTSNSKIGTKAGAFDGSDDNVTVVDGFTNTLKNDNTYTVSLWFNATSVASNPVLLHAQNLASPNGFFLELSTGRGFYWASGGSFRTYSAPAFTLNTWNHLAIVKSGSGDAGDLYINSQLVSSYTGSLSDTPNGNSGLIIGAFRSVGFELNGSLDEVAIWNTPLSATDVQTIYSRQSAKYAGQFTSRVMNYGSTNAWDGFEWLATLPFGKELPDNGVSESSTDYSSLIDANTTPTVTHDLMEGIVALWHLDEAVGTAGANSIKDTSGVATPNQGTPVGGVTFGVNGRFNTGASFDGSSGQISVAPWGIISGNAPRTISAWFNISSAHDELIINWGNSTTNNLSSIGFFSGEIGFGGYGTALTVPSAPYIDGTWHHLLVSHDGTTMRLYIDGAEKNNAPMTLATASTSSASIGYVSGLNWYFNGLIDEVAIWSRALRADEVLEVYRRGANRIKFQTRTCTTSDCSDRSASGDWLGPDGSNQSYFSELHNNSAFSVTGDPTGSVLTSFVDLSFSWFTSLTVATRQYFQYRTILESDDTSTACSGSWCSPELKSVTVMP